MQPQVWRNMLRHLLLVLLPSALARVTPPSSINNSTAPFIFNALSAALAQWPNTYHANGHSIIPGILEPYTLLYHARRTPIVPPPSPEWFAFDPEMSFGIMGGAGGHTYMLTYRNIRPVKVLYFDGMSAALSPTLGWLDSQDVLIARKGQSGGPRDYDVFDEYTRARRLCEWAVPRGVEGVVRMNSGFELMWCDFASPSIQLVSHLNITPPGTPPSPEFPDPPSRGFLQDPSSDPPHDDPPDRGGRYPGRGGDRTPRRRPWPFRRSPLAVTAFTEWVRAAAHRAVTPQPHVALDYSSFITFYHPRLHSLVPARQTQPMREHRIWPNVSEADAQSVLNELESVLSRKHSGSHMDWGVLARDIVESWADRIAHLHDSLANTTAAMNNNAAINVTESIAAVRRLTYGPLNPYMDTAAASNASTWDLFFSLGPSTPLGLGPNLQQFPVRLPHPPTSSVHATALQRCVHSSTGFLNHNPHIHKTAQEELLQMSVETILERLCTDFGTVFAESMDADDTPSNHVALTLFMSWDARIVALMEFLDWTEWLRCDEVCPRDSVCTMALWPASTWQNGRGSEDDDDPDFLKPRCISLVPETPVRRA
ncbi:hypothetical protein B0H21DRAFT_719773 [Amylocystis lapponica]|nr:hypothetical protein B0H21DRAFT_719773 [Amylocystis lapponica]